MSHLTDLELYYFNEGTTITPYKTLGCHRVKHDGYPMWRFTVWAPNAKRISVVGDWNSWNEFADPMTRIGETGVWECFIGIAKEGMLYKYSILGADDITVLKADPYAQRVEPEGSASVVWESDDYPWTDEEYLNRRTKQHDEPMNIYEVHFGSWKKGLSYRQLGDELVDYVVDMGYTHIEVMPLMAQ